MFLLFLQGSVALVAQQAFILNATVKSNILFGGLYDEEKYNQVIEACSLTHDFQMLPKGDKSMIGEKVRIVTIVVNKGNRKFNTIIQTKRTTFYGKILTELIENRLIMLPRHTSLNTVL